MSTKLTWIGKKAHKEPKQVFTSLYHHITDADNLRASYNSLDSNKAVGVDGVTKEEYGKNLEANLEDLSGRLKRMGYRPQAKRRTYIPKSGSDTGRPLGISSLEDKIVEEMVKRTIEPIYETVFKDSSYGYRPGRSQHQCLQELGKTIQQKRINHIVEADIRRFFDKMNHEQMMKFLEHRIGDTRVLRLIYRMLKSGIMEDGLTHASEEGTPQGSILSPLLSNIYLHYVLDLWFEVCIKAEAKGEAYYFRYADDFLACFQNQEDATNFLKELRKRLKAFHLELAEEKSNCIRFGRFARADANKRGKKPAEFEFLGFTHYCGKTRNGYFKVKRRTSRKKFNMALRKFTDWARKSRNVQRKGKMIRIAVMKVRGHLNYYAITDNLEKCNDYLYFAKRILYKWINRKSQRKTYTWEVFEEVLGMNKWPSPSLRKNLNPCCGTVTN